MRSKNIPVLCQNETRIIKCTYNSYPQIILTFNATLEASLDDLKPKLLNSLLQQKPFEWKCENSLHIRIPLEIKETQTNVM